MTLKRKILIAGGGSAGWMAASLMAKRWAKKGFEITLVESDAIGTIGVGEGSTPSIKNFFNELDIEESEWMPACNATYKNGITFKNWSTAVDCESYFHPFFSQLDFLNGDRFVYNTRQRRQGFAVDAHPDSFFTMTQLAKKSLAPLTPPEFPFNMEYSYHFDSSLLGKFLKKKALDFGAKHIEATIVSATLDDKGHIDKIITKCNKTLTADLFVDCTGFRSMLMQKTLQTPFVDYSNRLFNNAAVAMPTPITEEVPSETLSTALSNGWAWRIPLTNRFGNGYVYSSNYISPEQAEVELRTHIDALNSDANALHLKMRLGRLDTNWKHNCVAVGLSQGFIEPLEATALHFIGKTISDLIDAYEIGNYTSDQCDRHNKRIQSDFEHVSDYIHLHYLTNTRTDSPYWHDARNPNSMSDSLKTILDIWSRGEDLSQEIARQKIGGYYDSLSWHAMLAGVGIMPELPQCRSVPASVVKINMERIKDFNHRCSLNFRPHRTCLLRGE